jgi:hypothetical protein
MWKKPNMIIQDLFENHAEQDVAEAIVGKPRYSAPHQSGRGFYSAAEYMVRTNHQLGSHAYTAVTQVDADNDRYYFIYQKGNKEPVFYATDMGQFQVRTDKLGNRISNAIMTAHREATDQDLEKYMSGDESEWDQEQGVAEAPQIEEMDKSQTPPGRDGGHQFEPGPKVSKKVIKAVKKDPAKHLSDLFAKHYAKKKQGVAEGSENKTAIIYADGYLMVKIDGKMYKPKRMNHESGMGIAIHTPDKMYFSPIANEYEMPSETIYRALRLGGLKPTFAEGVAEGDLNEFAAGGDFKPPMPPKSKGNDPFGNDDRSKIVQAVRQLLKAGNKVDWKVPGQMGHVVSASDHGVILKRWNKPYSKINYSLHLSDDQDDQYQILLVKPGHYKVVSTDTSWNLEEQGVAEGSKEKDPVWNKGTPMPKDYTCHCGIHVHPSVKKPGAIHAKDCPYAKKQGVAEGSLKEYGDTPKGQKMLTKVQKRAVDRVVSKKADTDPKYAKKNQDTANRAWERMSNVDEQGVAEGKPNVGRHTGDKTVRVVRRGGKPIGEIGIDAEASPGQGRYYVKLYDGSVDLSGYDTAAEALEELRWWAMAKADKELSEDTPVATAMGGTAGQATAPAQSQAQSAALATAQQQQQKREMQDEIKNKQADIAQLQKSMVGV